MKLILFFIFLLNFSFCINKIEKTPPGAVKGIIDLTETQNGSELWDLEKDGIITLNGEWEFYWSNLIKGKCDSCAPQKYIQVPSQWQEFGFPIEGYAAYRLTIKLPKKYSNSKLEDFLDDRSLAIQMTDAATSYEMYINGKLISNNGIVGINKESSKPLLKHKVLDLSSIQILDSLEIIINVSNFYESKGGLWDTIKLGTSKQIKEASNYRYYLDFFVFSSLLIMGLYNIILFLSRKKDFSPLFFGIFSIITAIRIISTTNRVILDVFPGFSFLFLIKIEYLTFYLGAYFSVLFIYSFYKNEFSKKWLYGFSSVYLFTSSLVIILPLKYYTRSLTLVQITVLVEVFYVLYILFLAAKNKRDGAVIFLSGCSIFALTTINDILKGMSILFTPYLSSYGLLIFLFFLTIIISRRFALGIELAEKLSRDLILLNENLENKIHERTKDLEESKKEVETLNHFTQLINSLSSLEDIYVEITKYLYHQYKIQGSWLLLPDNKNEHLYTYKSYSFDRIPDRIYNYMLNKKIPLNEQGGLTAISFRRKKPYYSRKVTRHFTEIDREIMESLNIKNLLHIPLLLKNKSIGLFAFTNFNKDLILSKKEIKSISNLCYQVAGVIETTYLLEQVEKSKQKALELNSLIKSLNENMDIKIIMKKVLNFIKVKYGIQSFALYSLNKSFDQLELLDASFPDFLSLTDRKYILNLKIPLSKGKSAHALALKSKRPVFLQKIRTKGLTEEEIYLKDKLRIISFFMIPLMLNNETIGIIDFSNSSETINLTKEDITWFSILGEQISGIINGSNLFHQLQEEKEKVDIANKEIEKLNEFTKLVNSTLDISIIFKEIFSYLKETFDINSIWILLVDKDKSELYTEKAMTYSEDSDSIDVKYFLNFRKKIEPNLGTLYQTYKNKVPLLIPDYREVFNGEKNKVVNRFNGKVYYGSRTDLKISLKINSKAINQFPLIVLNEVIGILTFSTNNKSFESDIKNTEKIIRFSDQIAGVIQNAQLMKETEEARKAADIEKGLALVAQIDTEKEREKSENLLLNILPKEIANELKENGKAEPVSYDSVSVMFTDFKGFTSIANNLTPEELIKALDTCFIQFDKISEKFNLEKLKTIGDSYMCAGGIPVSNKTHAIDCVLAGFEIQHFIENMKKYNKDKFPFNELRLGIHSGPLVAGVIGEKKFAYDVWGDTVNTASRMESSGSPGEINISGDTYNLIKDLFECEYRGKVSAKNKGEIDMYFVHKIKANYSKDEKGEIPNKNFWEYYDSIS